MLGFFDEAGDPGLKVGDGSSRFFVVALVTFAEEEEALRCDRRIDELRAELHLWAGYEFHFAKNPWKIREAFLRVAQAFDFRYHLFILDKAAVIREGRSLRSPEALYQETAGLLFEQARPYLNNAVIVMDKRGDRQFRGGYPDICGAASANSGETGSLARCVRRSRTGITFCNWPITQPALNIKPVTGSGRLSSCKKGICGARRPLEGVGQS